MTDKEQDGTNSDLPVRRSEPGDLRSAIENPLAHLTEEQRQRLLEKAADAGLELNIEFLRQKLKHDAAWSDIERVIDQHIEMSRRTDTASRHTISSDHEVASGHVRIDAKKGCFVATVAFGSEDSPELTVLRGIRDDVLAKHPTGREFVSWYYRHGPSLAAYLSNHNRLRRLVSAALRICIAAASR